MSVPTKMVCLAEYEENARYGVKKEIFEYLEGKAGDGVTLEDNEKAFKRYKFRPKYLTDVSNLELNTTLLGHSVDLPVGASPFGFSALYHPDGEKAVAKACESLNTCFIQSNVSNYSIEEITQYAPNGLKWIQVYLCRTREVTLDTIRAAERNGYEAVVFTIDAPVIGRRCNDIRNSFKIPKHLRIPNFESDNIKKLIGTDRYEDRVAYVTSQFDQSMTWEDVRWLKEQTRLKLIIKGILTYEDAKLAMLNGADALFVSNHGGRQLDGVPATIDCLPEVARAAAGRCEVYLDGGVRSGSDILKALALGATAVFIARPAAWALIHNGEKSVTDMFNILREELRNVMSLTGVTSVRNVDKSVVFHQNVLGKL